MRVNADKPSLWKPDIAQSVDFFNDWFMRFAPDAYRSTRIQTTNEVKSAIKITDNFTNISAEVLLAHPSLLPTFRMATAPPIARDRLIGLAGVSPNLVRSMELDQRLPPRMQQEAMRADLERIGRTVNKLADVDILTWLSPRRDPGDEEVHRASTIIADRLCGAVADPIIRNAQEKRQLGAIRAWLEGRGYRYVESKYTTLGEFEPGTFSFRFNVEVTQTNGVEKVNIPIDAVILPLTSEPGEMPLLVEAKSAGDFTNTNKRRKEEATKISQLKATFGADVRFILFLCGYFDAGYLGYEAAEGLDWVWEHRIDDLQQMGL